MNVLELAAHCVQQINLAGNEAVVSLVLPGKWGKTNTKRLCPGGPRGEIVNETGSGVTVIFGAMDVLAFLTAKGLIQAVGPNGEDVSDK